MATCRGSRWYNGDVELTDRGVDGTRCTVPQSGGRVPGGYRWTALRRGTSIGA